MFTIHPTITDIIFPLNILLKGTSPTQDAPSLKFLLAPALVQARPASAVWDSYIGITALIPLHHLGLGTGTETLNLELHQLELMLSIISMFQYKDNLLIGQAETLENFQKFYF